MASSSSCRVPAVKYTYSQNPIPPLPRPPIHKHPIFQTQHGCLIPSHTLTPSHHTTAIHPQPSQTWLPSLNGSATSRSLTALKAPPSSQKSATNQMSTSKASQTSSTQSPAARRRPPSSRSSRVRRCSTSPKTTSPAASIDSRPRWPAARR